MTYTITIHPDGKYIIIKVKGSLYSHSAMKYTVDAHALGKEKGISKYLVDVVEAVNKETAVGNYDFADTEIDQNPAIDRGAKVACLVAPDDHSHDFLETLFINRGHNYRHFRNLKDALEFLEV